MPLPLSIVADLMKQGAGERARVGLNAKDEGRTAAETFLRALGKDAFEYAQKRGQVTISSEDILDALSMGNGAQELPEDAYGDSEVVKELEEQIDELRKFNVKLEKALAKANKRLHERGEEQVGLD